MKYRIVTSPIGYYVIEGLFIERRRRLFRSPHISNVWSALDDKGVRVDTDELLMPGHYITIDQAKSAIDNFNSAGKVVFTD